MKIISRTDSLIALIIVCDQFLRGFSLEIDLTLITLYLDKR